MKMGKIKANKMTDLSIHITTSTGGRGVKIYTADILVETNEGKEVRVSGARSEYSRADAAKKARKVRREVWNILTGVV